MQPLAHTILNQVIDIIEFKEHGIDCLIDNREEIAVDVGCILSQVTKQISKWLNYDIRRDFDKVAPPSVDVKLSDDADKSIEKMSYFNQIQYTKDEFD